MIYNVITIICLALMAFGLISVVLNLVLKNRAERITYLRSFKKGKGVIIYLVSFPLYWIGLIYGGKGIVDGLFDAVKKTIDLVVLKYDISSVQALVDANVIYRITIYTSFILVFLNAVLFALSLANQYVWNYFKNVKFRHSRKEKLVLFGNNEQNYYIYKSEKNRAKILIDKIDGKETLDLYMENVAYNPTSNMDRYIRATVNACVKRGKKIYAVINMGSDEKNINLSRIFTKYIMKLSEEEKTLCFASLKIFVFGDARFEAIYEDVISDSCGCISYVNKYQKIAIDFIDKYPFSKFMTGEHIDYQTSLVKKEVDINALFIGFGKTNQQIFLTSVANNQFITQTDNGVGVKKINYHIFDKYSSENNKNLNHNYNRYKNESVRANPKDYLPLPQYPAEERFYHLDINATNFYPEIRQIIEKKNGVNFIIIAFGSDLENIDMAQKLVLKCREWGIDKVNIFVKVRVDHAGQGLLEDDNCYPIGNEKEVVYNVESIFGDAIFNMAQMRNEVYDIEYELTQANASELTAQKVDELKAAAHKKWYLEKSQMERESSIFCCLSLRSKLNLMGLDYCRIDENDKPALTESEYLDRYAKSDLPDVSFYSQTVDGKPIVHYTLDFKESRRKNMAIHEHLRWNSFMISKGIVPASKERILNEKNAKGKYTNGKNYDVRRHGNITTFEGLVEFREMLAKRDIREGESMQDALIRKDVIKYDYQLLDDAFWLLNKNGYKIIRLEK